jgi:hypothetical protein
MEIKYPKGGISPVIFESRTVVDRVFLGAKAKASKGAFSPRRRFCREKL